MRPQANTIIDLETKFWQSMVDEDTDAALAMLCEPSLMVSSKGAMRFGHEDYRRMAEKGDMKIQSYQLSDMQVVFPNDDTAVVTYHARHTTTQRGKSDGAMTQEMNDSSTWVRDGKGWKCVMHTETPSGETARQ